jgi:hypothetical protein
MAVTVQFYRKFADYLGDGGLNLNTADLRLIPLAAAYSFNAAHDFADDLTNEVTTNGAARVALTGESWALAGDHGRLDCNDIVQTAAGGTLAIDRHALVDYTGSSGDADRELLALFNHLGASAGDGASITIQTPNGLFELRTS